MPPRRLIPQPPPAAVGLVLALLLVLACVDEADPRRLLETVPEPAGLEQLSPQVREQYAEYRSELDRLAADPSTDAARIGRAWGLLGMWHDLYEFYDSALRCYANAELLVPGDPRWPYYRAHIYRRRGPVEAARAAFGRVIELRPGDVPALTWLGEIELADGRVDAAAALFAAALDAAPSCVRARLGLGKVALERGDYAGAVQQLEAALAQQPAGTDIHYALGLAYRGTGELERAEEHLARGRLDRWERVPARLDDPLRIELQSLRRDLMHQNRTAKRLLREGRFEEAVNVLRQLVEEDPETEDWWINLSLALQQAGRNEEADRQMRATMERFPGHPRPYFGRGVFRAASGDFAGAEQDYRTAIEADPDYVEARFNLGRLLQQREKFAESVEQFARVVELDPANALARYWRAYGLTLDGRISEARRELQTDIGVVEDPGGHLTLLLARILATAPDPSDRSGEEALRLARAGQARRGDLAHAETVAMALAELGRFDRAQAWQQAALEGARTAGAPSAVLDWIRRRLDLYRTGRPCRQTWAPGEHPPASVPINAPRE